ncbi:uncharacterized protein LOC116812709 [Hylobates moloch]|uniref:uncharacterized protein LOC116812709 n=1 Tax=Hylobates moloch TaxID=81572 RepID=UPI0013F225FC|nr:uncharacterized protein LOC116812709 [Hylobates moloch]
MSRLNFLFFDNNDAMTWTKCPLPLAPAFFTQCCLIGLLVPLLGWGNQDPQWHPTFKMPDLKDSKTTDLCQHAKQTDGLTSPPGTTQLLSHLLLEFLLVSLFKDTFSEPFLNKSGGLIGRLNSVLNTTLELQLRI